MILKILKFATNFILLTLLTQVGGVIYMFYVLLKYFVEKYIGKLAQFQYRLSLFCTLYLAFTFLIIPPIAKQFGRVPMPYYSTNKTQIKPLNFLTVLLNRHYVRPSLKKQMLLITKDLQKEFPNTRINYLDANFPFINGFPLLPHLSHNDGKKLDLAFCYKNKTTGKEVNTSPAWLGYGVNEEPRKGEINQPNICRKKGYWQYGFLEKIAPQWNKEKLPLDEKRTKRLIQLLANNKVIKKIFIEPHLKTRWGLKGDDKIRYHGCHAVRHDDHIHVQL